MMVSRRLLGALVLMTVLVMACQPAQLNQTVNDTNMTDNVSEVPEEPLVNETPVEETEGPISVDRGTPPSKSNYSIVVNGVEGEVIHLQPKAIDPDGDAISYNFSPPFNEQGIWRTEIGDAGYYLVTVSAFDGVDTTRQNVLVNVSNKNLPPRMNCPEQITLTETEFLEIDCEIEDPEGDEVVTIYKGWIEWKTYKTTYDDAGTHWVTVKSWDKQNVNETVSQDVKIIIKELNRPPKVSFDFDQKITGMEGDVITVKPTISDPDGDSLDVDYSDPFNNNGVWKTEIGDAGNYNASVVVSDGENVVKKVFQVDIQQRNTAPVIERIQDVHVKEGETIDLNVRTNDREGDEVQVDISGFMESETYTTTYNDAMPNGCSTKGCVAEYTVTITATDGDLTSKQEVKVSIEDRNRPPVFRVPA